MNNLNKDKLSATGQIWEIADATVVDKLDDVYPAILRVRDLDQSDIEVSLQDLALDGLHGVKDAAEQIVRAVREKKKIVVYGDYDSDGISASTILWEFLYRELPGLMSSDPPDVVPFIPNREGEGYGLSDESLERLYKRYAPDMIITVDCGIRDGDVIKRFSKLHGVDFIVTDHHAIPEDFDTNHEHTVVHQLYPQQEYKYGEICGATVSFLLTMQIRQLLEPQWDISPSTPGLDLVALATVTDIMPLVGINRALVKAGLRQIKGGTRPGLRYLLEYSDIQLSSVSAYHLGYVIGPKINASGRIGDAMDAVRLLSTRSEKTAKELAGSLHELNKTRQELTEDLYTQAEKHLIGTGSLEVDTSDKDANNRAVAKKPVLMVVLDDAPEGILGLIAGRLEEKYHRPTLVATKVATGYKGSARSIPALHITQVLEDLKQYLVKFGGHAQAAGFTVKFDKLTEFQDGLESLISTRLDENDLVKVLPVDLRISTGVLSLKLADVLESLEPFGYGMRQPRFLLSGIRVADLSFVGKEKRHLKVDVLEVGGIPHELMVFSYEDYGINWEIGDMVDVVVKVSRNEWNGRSALQTILVDWREHQE